MSTRGLQPFLDTKQLYILHKHTHTNPSSIILSTNKRREKIKPLFDYKFCSFVAVDYFHSLRLVDTYIRALSFYVGNLFPYFSLGGHQKQQDYNSSLKKDDYNPSLKPLFETYTFYIFIMHESNTYVTILIYAPSQSGGVCYVLTLILQQVIASNKVSN